MLDFLYDIFASEAYVVDDPHMIIDETPPTVMYIGLEATGWFRCSSPKLQKQLRLSASPPSNRSTSAVHNGGKYWTIPRQQE